VVFYSVMKQWHAGVLLCCAIFSVCFFIYFEQRLGFMWKMSSPKTTSLHRVEEVKQLISKKKDKMERLPNSNATHECGTWHEWYSQLHADILANKTSHRRFLVWKEHNGYADRLKGISTALYLAVLSERALLLQWDSPAPLESVLEPLNIQWNASIELQGLSTTKLELYPEDLSSHQFDFITKFEQYDVVELIVNYPAEQLFFIGQMNQRADRWSIVKTDFLVGCAFWYLFRPTSTVQTELERYKDKGLSDATFNIGVHIRTGIMPEEVVADDNKPVILPEKWGMVSQCLLWVEQQMPVVDSTRVKWFVASDNDGFKQFMKTNWQQKVVITNYQPAHINRVGKSNRVHVEVILLALMVALLLIMKPWQKLVVMIFAIAVFTPLHWSSIMGKTETDAQLAAIVDHLLLSQCEFLVVSPSGFGRTAAQLAFNRNILDYEACWFINPGNFTQQ
jgi:hypothetical protein